MLVECEVALSSASLGCVSERVRFIAIGNLGITSVQKWCHDRSDQLGAQRQPCSLAVSFSSPISLPGSRPGFPWENISITIKVGREDNDLLDIVTKSGQILRHFITCHS